MDIFSIFTDYSLYFLLMMGFFAFLAGFIDAAVGGGGLIQIPVLLISFPEAPLASLFGTSKIAGLSGTSIAALKYAQKVRFDLKLLLIVSFFSLIAAYFGARAVSYIDTKTLKPFILVLLVGIAIYTFAKKDLGALTTKTLSFQQQALYGSILGTGIGFYDGFFGPGTGSFLVFGFVILIGFDFLKASAYAKVINCVTNVSALYVFLKNGNYILGIALVMAIFNIAGNYLGSTMAIKKGNAFIRVFFLIIVSILIVRYALDVFQLA